MFTKKENTKVEKLDNRLKELWLKLIDDLRGKSNYFISFSYPESYFNELKQSINNNLLDKNLLTEIHKVFFLQPNLITHCCLRDIFRYYNTGSPYSVQESKKIILDSLDHRREKYSKNNLPIIYTTEMLPKRDDEHNSELIVLDSFDEKDYGNLSFFDAILELRDEDKIEIFDFYILYTDSKKIIFKVKVNYKLPLRILKKIDVEPIDLPENTKWEDITMKFKNDYDVKIEFNSEVIQSDYEKMGFADGRIKRSEDMTKARAIWKFLHLLSARNGQFFLDGLTGKEKEQRKKQKQLLTKNLKELFPNIKDDPFYEYDDTNGVYKIKIKLIPIDIFREDFRDRNIKEETEDKLGLEEEYKKMTPIVNK